MEPKIPMSKIASEAEWLGKMLLKVKDVKTEEDLKNFKGLGLFLKSLIAYNCYNLVYEIKNYFMSLGMSKETVEKYGRQYFHEGYLENCKCYYTQELKIWKEEKQPKTILQKIFRRK